MEGEAGVSIARHGVVRSLRDCHQAGVTQFASVNESSVEQFEFLL